ncbi:MAG: VWA domain-containing protein, partial [Planctomycetes bacterium]|nr:VWA domain-containing protein [Planctomycetota bacterium]
MSTARTTRISALSLLVLAAAGTGWLPLPSTARADGLIFVHDPPPVVVIPYPHPYPPRPPRPPRPLPPPPPPRPHFPLKVTKHRVEVVIDDTLARTRVEETFYNPNSVQLEGTYLFPLPDSAAVSGFVMKIGGREATGEVLEKDKAREIYEGIVRKARDPGLLEYVDRGLFQARVFPIPARGGVDVTFEYSESLRRTGGLIDYRYPLDTGKYSAGDYENVVIDAKLRSSQAIRAVHCPTHEVSISRSGENDARVGFEAKTLRADKDFVLQYSVGEDALAPLLVTHRGHEKDGFFYLSIYPRPEKPREVPPKDLVFVIDTSGSMTGRKIEQVKKALRYSIENLNAGDRFNIVDFSTEARRFRPDVVEVGEETKRQANLYIDEMAARGGTNIEEGMRFGLESAEVEGRLQMIVLLTDGEPTFGVIQPAELLASIRKKNPQRRRTFVFGVGEDLNAKLLDSIVRENRGAAQFIRGDENLEIPLSAFYDKIDSPVLTDLSIEVVGGGVSAVYPKPLPDLFRGEQLDVFGLYESDGLKTVVIKGMFQGEPRVFEHSLEFRGDRNDHIPRLWAMRQIGALLEQMRLGGESRELKEEVIRLSKLYGVITPYTSYLIVEEESLARAPRAAPSLGLSPGTSLRSAARDAIAGPPALAGGEAGGGDAATKAWEWRRRELLEEVRAEAEDFGAERGAGAVRLSRQLGDLKAGRLSSSDREFVRSKVESSGVRFQEVGDRTFYLQSGRWIDAALTTKDLDAAARLRRVKYLSDEYFDLLKASPGIGRYLAVGSLVTFLFEGELISIVE